MAKIPFKVSARTALLIGRENVATAKGALIEIVKNCYDADSPIAIVYFDNRYSEILPSFTHEYADELTGKGVPLQAILDVYDLDLNGYVLKNIKKHDADSKEVREAKEQRAIKLLKAKHDLKAELGKLNVLYIIDFGDGMAKSVIENYWMTIGTNNKLDNHYTGSGRVKAGAKGIGRFALDRLGKSCEMITFSNPESITPQLNMENESSDTDEPPGFKWNVNWMDFEEPLKTINDVGAELSEIRDSSFSEELVKNVNIDQSLLLSLNEQNHQYGTLLKISNLRDLWTDDEVNEMFSDLEVLVPPKETADFKIFLYSSLKPNKYGEVLSSLCHDFDYKVVATATEDQKVNITIFRKEYEVEAIPDRFFSLPEVVGKEQYSKETFIEGSWTYPTNFSQLLPGYQANNDNQLSRIGPFKFTFYFLKRSYNSEDKKLFFYKSFNSGLRKKWLEEFGGIKIFRDNFRVRPYGESNNVAFDWLGLGSRKAASPAGVGKQAGGYRVEPESVSGAINISRLTNISFEDKSSREGLQENTTFDTFKKLLAAIIKVFEDDRSFIARQMKILDDELYGAQREMEKAELLAKAIMQRAKEADESANAEEDEEPSIQNANEVVLAQLISVQTEKIERLQDEQILLRGLASSGIVSAAFGHDLSKVSDILESRVDKLYEILKTRIGEHEFDAVEKRKNPFELLRRIKSQDLKIRNWLNFSLGFTKKDKRKRQGLLLSRYFDDFQSEWALPLQERLISLNLQIPEGLEMRVFELDFDSIFSNLIINSIEAFILSETSDAREISLTCTLGERDIVFDYKDSGPGLSKDIVIPEKVFDPLFTTKYDSSGDEIGTGLGMWIIKSIVEENDGSIQLLYPEKGFGVRMMFPSKYK